jgi:hypothetical protein
MSLRRLAVAEGFEPSRESPPYTLSRRAPSSARAGHRRRFYERHRQAKLHTLSVPGDVLPRLAPSGSA